MNNNIFFKKLVYIMNDDVFKSHLIKAGKIKMEEYEDDSRLEVLEKICRDFQSKRYCWRSY